MDLLTPSSSGGLPTLSFTTIFAFLAQSSGKLILLNMAAEYDTQVII